jgi:hypothetical protein
MLQACLSKHRPPSVNSKQDRVAPTAESARRSAGHGGAEAHADYLFGVVRDVAASA